MTSLSGVKLLRKRVGDCPRIEKQKNIAISCGTLLDLVGNIEKSNYATGSIILSRKLLEVVQNG